MIIEIDLTEARRIMTGLAVFSQGKYFWMNNGASWYNDYTSYRAKSMRTIPNQFAGIIPLELFTYANYPHNDNKSKRYNVNTSLVAGHGFWGALEFMKKEERHRVGKLVSKSKRVLPYITESAPSVIGKVGGSSEIYTQVNEDESAGQIIAFSGQALKYQHTVRIRPNKFLGVLNHAYNLREDTLIFNFEFPMPGATREAFIIPNQNNNISIISSTSWLNEIKLENDNLEYVVGAPGNQTVLWGTINGEPEVVEQPGIITKTEMIEKYYLIKIKALMSDIRVKILKNITP